jgi:phytoene dehydrogenase-like protein
MSDALVIGAGPNGLVAANVLADHGWSVEVLEAQPRPGGAVKSGEIVEPDFVNDEFSAFYPLAAASPVIRRFGLEQWGLEWAHGPLSLAHPAADGTCVVLSRDLDETAASFDAFAPGDGEAWRELFSWWGRVGAPLLDALVTPLPPVRPGLRLARRLGRDLPEFARLGTLSVRRLAAERFRGAGGGRLLAGNAMHADLLPESALGGFFGWLLSSLGQTVGYPCAGGGASNLTHALVRRLEARGGRVICDARVDEIVVERGRAVGVRTAAGAATASKAILADVHAVPLYLDLLPRSALPQRVLDAIGRFEHDPATFKLDWTLDGPIPWTAPDARRAPVVHVADSLDELSITQSELARGLVPTRPFIVMGQYSMADPTRMPAGKEVAWGYTHLPQGADGGANRGACAGVPRPRPSAPGDDAAGAGSGRREPAGRCALGRDVAAAPAARLPSDPGSRAAGDTGAGPLPRLGLRPPWRRRARRPRRDRRARRPARHQKISGHQGLGPRLRNVASATAAAPSRSSVATPARTSSPNVKPPR